VFPLGSTNTHELDVLGRLLGQNSMVVCAVVSTEIYHDGCVLHFLLLSAHGVSLLMCQYCISTHRYCTYPAPLLPLEMAYPSASYLLVPALLKIETLLTLLDLPVFFLVVVHPPIVVEPRQK